MEKRHAHWIISFWPMNLGSGVCFQTLHVNGPLRHGIMKITAIPRIEKLTLQVATFLTI